MISVALKGLAARKMRALLTAFAVVIGVSMVSGTFILTDTMQKSFNGLFTASYAKTDAVISGKEIVKNSTSDNGVRLPASLLTKVRALPEVAAAGGEVSPQVTNAADILDGDGKKAARESIGGGFDPANARFSPLKLKTGTWAKGSGQVVIDAGTASKKHYKLGDPIVISTLGAKHTYKITGTVSFGDVDSLGLASIAAWDLKTAQTLLHREGSFDAISIAARPGVSPAQLVRAVKPLVPANMEVKDSDAKAKEDAANLDDSLSSIRMFLLGFGFIALLVGAFVIFNTLSITVAQRTREFATLRTLGASRKQVMRSVRLEGLVLGIVASVIGIGLGIGLAQGMVALLSALGLELPEASSVIQARTINVSLLLGTGITLIASIVPARRATRVPPIAAVREGATLPPSRFEGRSRSTGIGVVGASLAAISAGVFAGGLSGAAIGLLLGVGVLGLFGGIALLAPHLVRPLTAVVGWPARRGGGVAGELAGSNSVRNPRRTASTAAALMIGLCLITLVAVLGASITSATKSAVTDQLHADHVVDGKDAQTFRADGGDKLAAVDGVSSSTQVRSETAIVGAKKDAISGIDPATITHFYKFKWTTGTQAALSSLGADGAIVTKAYADDQHLTVGERVALTTPAGAKRTLVVRGIYDAPPAEPLLGDISISKQAFDHTFANPKNSYTFLDANARAGAEIEATAKALGDTTYHTGAAFPKDVTKDMATMLAMLYVLLGFSVVVSLFGMVNTMVLSVFERTREIGMLRTIGMTRRQARRMIRHESIITALIGAAMGLGLGVFLAVVTTQAVPDATKLTLPWPTLASFTAVAVAAGVVAAIMPARRASKLNVLEALHYE